MKANELRLGNYVCVTEKYPLKVKIINDEAGIMSTVSDNSIFITTASLLAFKPIPLTEDWLLKFGFKKDNNFTWVDLEMELMQREDGFWIWLGADLYLKHVHQLQNLYHALTRKELTIKQNDEK